MPRRLLALLLLGIAPVASAASSQGAAAADVTCQGETVTHVGTPGEVLMGTDEADVIETNGAREVYASGGDDLICVDGLSESDGIPYPTVYAGEGDDSVVVTQSGGYTELYVLLGLGVDSFVGGRGSDIVAAKHFGSDEPTDGFDSIATGAGADEVTLQRDASLPGADSVDLGAGRDTVLLAGPVGLADEISGGDGLDTVALVDPACAAASIDASTRAATCNGDPAWEWDDDIEGYAASTAGLDFTGTPGPDRLHLVGTRHADVTMDAGSDVIVLESLDDRLDGIIRGGIGRDLIQALPGNRVNAYDVDLAAGSLGVSRGGRAELSGVEDLTLDAVGSTAVGNGQPNRIEVRCAGAPVRGGAGDDVVRAIGGGTCRQTFIGGSGADVLVGGPGPDRLVGGAGRDRAVGGRGRDVCSAEVRRSCEI